MIPEERRNQILAMLYKSKSVTVKMLCDQLQASEATIRRDLAILDEESKLERVHGGAVIQTNMPLGKEETFDEKESSNVIDKKRIAESAFSYLRDNDSVFLDGGTTTLELARLIGRSRIRLQVFTNAPHFVKYLADNPKVDLFVIGGKIRNNTLAVVGQLAVETIRKFRINKVFLGVNAISLEYGLTTPDFEEAQTKKAMLEAGRERFVLADASKFNKVALCEIAPVGAVDTIITSAMQDMDLQKQYKEAGIHIVEAFVNKEEINDYNYHTKSGY